MVRGGPGSDLWDRSIRDESLKKAPPTEFIQAVQRYRCFFYYPLKEAVHLLFWFIDSKQNRSRLAEDTELLDLLAQLALSVPRLQDLIWTPGREASVRPRTMFEAMRNEKIIMLLFSEKAGPSLSKHPLRHLKHSPVLCPLRRHVSQPSPPVPSHPPPRLAGLIWLKMEAGGVLFKVNARRDGR
jgi:hypothetical protein